MKKYIIIPGILAVLIVASAIVAITLPSKESKTTSNTVLPINNELAGNAPFIGNDTAPVVMIDFSDPQCPSCREFHDYDYPIIKQNYIDKGLVKFVTVNVILPQDPASIPSFMAASCARRQLNDSGFFNVEDLIYEKQHEMRGNVIYFNNSLIKDWVKNAGFSINYSEWENCFDTNATRSIIMDNQQRAASHSINSLPTVFVNGVPIVGFQPYSIYKAQIDAALKQ